MLIGKADTVVLLLEFGPSAIVPVALLVTMNQCIPGVCGRVTCCVRWMEPLTASVPGKVKLPSSVGLCPWSSVAVYTLSTQGPMAWALPCSDRSRKAERSGR